MKKPIWLTLLLLLALMLPITAQAAPRSSSAKPSLSFSGTTATCKVTVYGTGTKDSISLTAKLWKGSECIATWTASGTGRLDFSKTKTIEKGSTYKLTADATVNGTKLSTTSATGTCR